MTIQKTTLAITLTAAGPNAKSMLDDAILSIQKAQYSPVHAAKRTGETASLVFTQEWEDGHEEGGQMEAAGPAGAKTATDTAKAEATEAPAEDNCECLDCQIRRSVDKLAGEKGGTLGGGMRIINISDLFRKPS